MAKYIYCKDCIVEMFDTLRARSIEPVVGNSKFQTKCGRCGRDIYVFGSCAQILTDGDKSDNTIVPVDESDPVFPNQSL